MKTNIATTPEQSQRLLACGVPADTADMMYSRFNEDRDMNLLAVEWQTSRVPNRKISVNCSPAWSLSRLLALIPHTIKTTEDEDYYFSLAQEYAACLDYKAAYKSCWSDWEDDCVSKCSTDPIEACVQLIEWLMQNNYKLNEIKE